MTHECEAGVSCEHDVSDLNPRAQASKANEMAVLRTSQLIEAWEELPKGGDWADVPMATYRKILGTDHYQQRTVLTECWKRWKSGTLYGEVLDLYDNLPPAAQRRKEIKDAVAKFRRRPGG